MPSELDLQMDATLRALLSPNGPMPFGPRSINGREELVFLGAPPDLPSFFRYFCTKHGDAEALVMGGERLTYSQMLALAEVAARQLVRDHGVGKGDVVALAMRNAPEWVILFMAIVMAGGVVALLNGFWKSEELEHAATLVGTRLILADEPRAVMLDAAPWPGHRPVIVRFGLELPAAEALSALGMEDPELSAVPLPQMAGGDAATLLFTSGSTGQSKGAWSHHFAIGQAVFGFLAATSMVYALRQSAGVQSPYQPSILVSLPLFHVTGLVPVLLQSMAIGRKIVILPKWDAVDAMETIERERITYFVGVPLMNFEIASHPDRDKYDLSSCADYASGGAAQPAAQVLQMAQMPHGKPLSGYGLTETNGLGCINFGPGYIAKPASAGRPLNPLVDLKIVDDAGNPLPQGQNGEVAIRSVGNFAGYWKDEAATQAAMTPTGHFRTGDIGYLDEDGYLFIVDRKKDIIIRAGENIASAEVEAILYGHPAIAECAVIGLPDPVYGELPAAVVYLDPKAARVDQSDLQQYLGLHLATFKIPVVIWIATHPLPRLGTAKIDKVGIRREYRSLYKGEAGA